MSSWPQYNYQFTEVRPVRLASQYRSEIRKIIPRKAYDVSLNIAWQVELLSIGKRCSYYVRCVSFECEYIEWCRARVSPWALVTGESLYLTCGTHNLILEETKKLKRTNNPIYDLKYKKLTTWQTQERKTAVFVFVKTARVILQNNPPTSARTSTSIVGRVERTHVYLGTQTPDGILSLWSWRTLVKYSCPIFFFFF